MPLPNPNCIIHGDCASTMQSWPDGIVDLAFADPPFNIGYTYDEYDDRRPPREYLDWCGQWMHQVHRILKPNGTFWLAIGDEYAAELKVLATREVGFYCRNWVIWHYTFGVHCTGKFTRSHAHLLYFVKDRKAFTFNADDPAVRVPSARQLVYGDARANPQGRMPDDTWIIPPKFAPATVMPASEAVRSPKYEHHGWVLRPQDLPEGFAADADTWYFARVAGTFKERAGFHGCQMPEQLLGRIIRACSKEGDLVFDPFTGSGTTLAVARKLKRQYIGTELSAEYQAEATARLGGIRPGDELDGVEDPLRSVPDTCNGVIRAEGGRRIRAIGRPAPQPTPSGRGQDQGMTFPFEAP